MNNLKFILLILIHLSTQFFGMEAPQQPPLPADVQRLIVPLIASSKVIETAKTILALNVTNKTVHNYLSNPANIITVAERMPYTANGIDLIEYLQKTKMPVIKDSKLTEWLVNAKKGLKNGVELYFVAVTSSYPRIIELLHDKNIDLNWKSGNERSPLLAATRFFLNFPDDKRKKIVKLLIDAGANPNIQDDDGDTPLRYAVARGNKEAIKLFLLAAANPI